MFSETTCNFEGLFVVVGFYSFSWVFDFSASSERECVGEGEIASHPAFLCISVYLDSPLPCSPPPIHSLFLSPPQRTEKLSGLKKTAFFRQCLKCGGREG